MTELRILTTGIAFGESPRWRAGRLWLADWGAQEVLAVDPDGRREVVARVDFPSIPMGIDWSRDGHLLIVSAHEGRLLRRADDGALALAAKLPEAAGNVWNEIVVDGRGNAYINGGRFGAMDGPPPGTIALVTPDGAARTVATGLAFPNGMAVTPDNATLIVAESYANRLTAFDIAADGGLNNRRVWADLSGGFPDGICLDAEGAVWYADVPNQRCVRVRAGGAVAQTIDLDRGCFACILGGADGRTLFMVTRVWGGMEQIDPAERTGQIVTATAPAPRLGWP